MSFDGSDGLREFFSDEFGCEAWPSGKVAIVDGFDPGQWDRASTGGMQVGDQVGLCRCMVGTVCVVLRMREGPRWLSRLRLCWSWLEGHFPQAGIRIAISYEDDGVAVRKLDMLFVEGCGASVVAQEANGEQGVGKIGK